MVETAAAADTGIADKRVPIAAAAVLALLGLTGHGHAAIGYALFLIATMLIFAGLGLMAIFALTRWFDTAALRRGYAVAFWAGAWSYVLSVSSLAGYYVHEAAMGRVEWYLVVFGPAILAAIVILDIGIWRVIVERNLPTMRRFGDLWSRDALDQPRLRRTLTDEVILHRSLFGVSRFRWLRHQLIFWGFGLMFLTELVAVAFREAFPAFGWTYLWHDLEHPVRLAFDLVFEVTGVMILLGCLLALAFRVMVEGREEQKYTDTPTTLFLLAVTVTGFWAEGLRLAMTGSYAGEDFSFLGRALAGGLAADPALHDRIWLLHALLACAFIAYVPVKRMIHSCATPIGRLANSQTGLMAAKKARVVAGLFRQGR